MTAHSSTTDAPSGKLHITLWVLQVLLAAAFLVAGSAKAFLPIDELATNMPWAAAVPVALVRFIGATQLLAGLGLTLPSALRILPVLTPLAAIGLLITMVLAFGLHLSRGEYDALLPNIVIGALTAFIAWGRLMRATIPARRRAS